MRLGKPRMVYEPSVQFNAEECVKIRKGLLDWYDTNHRHLPWRHNPHSRSKPSASLPVKRTPDKQLKVDKRQRTMSDFFKPKQNVAKVENQSDGKETAMQETKPVEEAQEKQPSNSNWPKLEGISRDQYAYLVWVSEIMLQQTQVATVIPYYIDWVQRWPTVSALSQATIEEVRGQWSGLGYYRRCENLLAGAQFVMDKCDGLMPSTVDSLRNIPGIGEYTAGAIASIAFGVQTAAVDGNVIRVMARMRCMKGNPSKAPFKQAVTALVNSVQNGNDRPGCLTQSLMELGATMCTPTNPSCSTCPVSSECHVYQVVTNTGDAKKEYDIEDTISCVTQLPEKVQKSSRKVEYYSVSVLVLYDGCGERQHGVLIRQRQAGGLLGGQWEFPCQQVEEGCGRKALGEQAVCAVNGVFQVQGEGVEEGSGKKSGKKGKKQVAGKGGSGSDGEKDKGAEGEGGEQLVCVKSESVVYSGHVKHIFSHIEHNYYVHVIMVEQGQCSEKLLRQHVGEDGDGQVAGVQWVAVEDCGTRERPLTTGQKKIWNLCKDVVKKQVSALKKAQKDALGS